jgi:hypothetical protein
MEAPFTDTVAPLCKCFESAASKDAAVISSSFTAKAISEICIHWPLQKIRKIGKGSLFGFFKAKLTKKKSGGLITFVMPAKQSFRQYSKHDR